MGNCNKGMFNIKLNPTSVRVGNGQYLTANKIGDKRLCVLQKDGSTQEIVLKDYKYIPQLTLCLVSITKALEGSWSLSNKGKVLILKKGLNTIRFDHQIRTEKGYVLGVEIVPSSTKSEISALTLEKGIHIDINKAHQIISHVGEDPTRSTARYYGWVLTGHFNNCEECQIGNIKQKGVSKKPVQRSTIPGQQIFLDIAGIKYSSYGGNKYWVMLLDECTDFVWSIFAATKSGMIKPVL